jgi:hypothetical protein
MLMGSRHVLLMTFGSLRFRLSFVFNFGLNFGLNFAALPQYKAATTSDQRPYTTTPVPRDRRLVEKS